MTELISLRDAARMLGYTEKGLRKIVDRSRAAAKGARTYGPTIRFFQTTRGAPVKFRQEWLEEFIERHTVDPQQKLAPPTKQKRKIDRRIPTGEDFGLDSRLLDL